MPATSAIICTSLGYEWPDGSTPFRELDLVVNPGRCGLVGRNGSGKSTLLRLVAGELTPSTGTVHSAGQVAYLPQVISTAADVAGLLGIDATLAALTRIERGAGTIGDFEIVSDDWDVEARAVATLEQVGVRLTGAAPLRRPVGTLSGGETVQVALAGCLLQRPDILLLDEPTNNLDRPARERLYDTVAGRPGVTVVVSHDRELLDLMDTTVELRDGATRSHGGNFTSFTSQLRAEREVAERRLRSAESEVRTQQQQLIAARTVLDRRVRYGKKMYEQKREPRIIMNARKTAAQESAGRHRNLQIAKVDEAHAAARDAADAVRDDDLIRIDLPETAVPAGRTLLEITVGGITSSVRGPERIAVLGRNGAGKTTLLREISSAAAIVGDRPALVGRRRTVRRYTDRISHLPQRLDLLDDRVSVLENLRATLPTVTPHEIRARLARFLLRGDAVDRPAATLSGGERFRATLAMLLLAEPPPQLLILDEPTNNLDLDSCAQLVAALADYRGALLVASHDMHFLEALSVQRFWTVDGPELRDEGAG